MEKTSHPFSISLEIKNYISSIKRFTLSQEPDVDI